MLLDPRVLTFSPYGRRRITEGMRPPIARGLGYEAVDYIDATNNRVSCLGGLQSFFHNHHNCHGVLHSTLKFAQIFSGGLYLCYHY